MPIMSDKLSIKNKYKNFRIIEHQSTDPISHKRISVNHRIKIMMRTNL